MGFPFGKWSRHGGFSKSMFVSPRVTPILHGTTPSLGLKFRDRLIQLLGSSQASLAAAAGRCDHATGDAGAESMVLVVLVDDNFDHDNTDNNDNIAVVGILAIVVVMYSNNSNSSNKTIVTIYII